MSTEIELHIGDKVCYKEFPRWGSIDGYYSLTSATVERITNTLYVLSSGVKLRKGIRNVNYSGDNFIAGWNQQGDNWKTWQIETPEITQEAAMFDKKQKEYYKVVNWFSSRKFTYEEKIKIFELFNQD